MKNDRRDAKNIAANLANGTYKSVYVPTDEDVEIKEYIRMMLDFKLELKKVKQHINAFLLRFVISILANQDGSRLILSGLRNLN